MNFPEYKKINRHYEVAVLIDELKPEAVADTINELLNNEVKRNLLRENCLKAKQELNWQNEEKKLVEFYRKIFAEDR